MSRDNPAPAGFGKCYRCAYRESGTSFTCYQCARQDFQEPDEDCCTVCCHPLKSDGECGNPICSWDDRWFDRNVSIAFKTGRIEYALKRYKYENQKGWAYIFSRVLTGFLFEHDSQLGRYDFIIPSPTYVSSEEESRSWDHTRLVLEKANDAVGWLYGFCLDPVIIKSAPTKRMVGHSWRERKQIAETELRFSLQVVDPDAVEEKNIIVYDDVFTEGFTINEVARALKQSGASSVSGLTLVRGLYMR